MEEGTSSLSCQNYSSESSNTQYSWRGIFFFFFLPNRCVTDNCHHFQDGLQTQQRTDISFIFMKLRPIYFKCNFLLVQNYLLSTDLFRTSCLLSEQERSNLVTVVSLPTKTQRSKLLVFKVEVTLDNPPPHAPVCP